MKKLEDFVCKKTEISKLVGGYVAATITGDCNTATAGSANTDDGADADQEW